MPNFASLSCFYSKLRWGGFFAPPVQNRVPKYPIQNRVKHVRDRSAIMVCKIKFGAKILPVYNPLNIKVK